MGHICSRESRSEEKLYKDLKDQLCEDCYFGYIQREEPFIAVVRGNMLIPHKVDMRLALLDWAVERGHAECLRNLMKVKRIDVKTRELYDILNKAAMHGYIGCIKVLLEAGVDVNCENNSFSFPLLKAAFGYQRETLKFLLEKGANVNQIAHVNKTKTALSHAVDNDDHECLDVLLKAGADVNIVYENGATILNKAAWSRSISCINLLLQAGADVNEVDSYHNTPLIVAAEYNINCVKLLLRANAKINMFNANGRNALCNHVYSVLCNFLSPGYNQPDRTMVLLLYAAGETLDGITADDDEKMSLVLNYLEKRGTCLKHLCREAIRKHLLDINCWYNLFDRVPKLGLPELLSQYMLFNMSLNYPSSEPKVVPNYCWVDRGKIVGWHF